MEPSYHLLIDPVEVPTEHSIPQNPDTPFFHCFYIDFTLSYVSPPSNTNPATMMSGSAATYTTLFNDNFFVPVGLLCDCDDFSDTSVLHDAFSSVPVSPALLDLVLLHMGDMARDMVSHNSEVRHVLGMDVTLIVATRPGEDDDDDSAHNHQHVSMELETHVNSLEKVFFNDDDDDDLSEQCAICLEKFLFLHESELEEVVRTPCLHVFHQHCIIRWLKYSDNSRSCPLCRGQIKCLLD